MKFLYKCITYICFVYLFIRYGNVKLKLKFKSCSSQLQGGKCKAKTSLHKDNTISMVIDLGKHNSLKDILNTVFHEFRHACQYRDLPLDLLLNDQEYGKTVPDIFKRAAYSYSILELDAKYFEQQKKWIPISEIPSKILEVESYTGSRLKAGMIVAQKYDINIKDEEY